MAGYGGKPLVPSLNLNKLSNPGGGPSTRRSIGGDDGGGGAAAMLSSSRAPVAPIATTRGQLSARRQSASLGGKAAAAGGSSHLLAPGSGQADAAAAAGLGGLATYRGPAPAYKPSADAGRAGGGGSDAGVRALLTARGPSAHRSSPAVPRTPSQQDTHAGGEASGGGGPLTPAQALQRYSDHLTAFEQSEVLEYPSIYFLGRSPGSKVRGNPHQPARNFGYDDDR